ncbi:MAG: hypothetical protein ACOXZZ_05655 [Sphaerochaetaceae bacterium]|jgi:hypothetical protein
MKKVKTLLLIVLLVITLSSCVVQQALFINQRGGGESTTNLNVDQFFVDLLDDFELLAGGSQDKSYLDNSIENFVNNLRTTDSAYYATSSKVGLNSYLIEFSFSSFEKLLDELNEKEKQSIVKIRELALDTTLNINLNIDNYPQLVKMVPFLAEPNFETFGPLYNEGISEDEYLEMVSYILGEQAPSSIESSIISLQITLPKNVKRLTNGTKISAKVVRFDIPLIDFLLLAEPIIFQVTW